MSHLTKFDPFRLNKDQAMELETWFKIRTNVSNVETASTKTIINSQLFYNFCDTLKNGQAYIIFM